MDHVLKMFWTLAYLGASVCVCVCLFVSLCLCASVCVSLYLCAYFCFFVVCVYVAKVSDGAQAQISGPQDT